MTQTMTLSQLEKAQKLANLIATVSNPGGYMDIELAKQVFNLANGIDEDEKSAMAITFKGGLEFSDAKVINYCNCK